MKTLPVAVQVYSVRDDAERDFKGTMQKIKDMGYDGVILQFILQFTSKSSIIMRIDKRKIQI